MTNTPEQVPDASPDSATPAPVVAPASDETPQTAARSGVQKLLRWPVIVTAITVCALVIGALTIPRLLTPAPAESATDAQPDLTLDSDGDGIPDHVEISGWSVESGEVYLTDPLLADTDGDGLSDSEEAGELSTTAETPYVYTGVSNPTLKDSDSDGLDDKAEVHGWSTVAGDRYLTDPLNPDSDHDGLYDGDEAGEISPSDGGEVIYEGFSNPEKPDSDEDGLNDADEASNGTNPFAHDTDGDGLSDEHKDSNREALGLDPLFEDVEVSAWDYAGDFAKGALAGEAWRDDSMAWLAGNLVSSGTSLIPGIGWIIGGVADVRDTIASAIQADWVGAGFSAVGLVPYAGDAAAIPSKAASFVLRHPELAAGVGALIVALNKVPEAIKVDALKQITQEWDTLRAAGPDSKALLQTQMSGRINLDSIGSAIKRENHVPGAPSRFLADGKAGEASLVSTLSLTHTPVTEQVRASTASCAEVCNAQVRVFDAVADGVAHESKVGFKTLDPLTKAQISSDAYLVKTGVINNAHWHFYPSAHTSQLGATKPLLDYLEANGIRFTIHAPVSK